MYIDIHAHLDHEYFNDKLDMVINQARELGFKAIITSGVNTPSNRKALEISKKYDIVKFSAGLYPIDLISSVPDEAGLPRQLKPINMEEEFEFIKNNKENITAIGEVGLDYQWDNENHEKQKENFQRIIEFTEKLKKPIIVHTRKAEKDCLDMLESSSIKKINLHCFMGNKRLIKRASDLGYSFSIPSIILKLQHFQMLVETVNLNQLLTETDCPWLSSSKDKRSDPTFVVQTVKKISEIKKLDEDETKKNIFMNYQNFFL